MKSLVIAPLLALSLTVGAQEKADSLSSVEAKENKFTIDLDMLNRGEIRKGGLPKNEKDDDLAAFVVERTLLGASYERSGLQARVTAQHSGTWGSDETNAFNLFEAWVKISSKTGFFAQAGRQSLSYDDERIFGADDWAMTAMSHDALKVGYEGHGHKLHLIGAFNQNVENINGGTYFKGGLQPYKALEAVWYHYDVPKFPLGASLLFMNVGMQDKGNLNDTCTHQQQLIGTHLTFKPKHFSFAASFYYQFGKDESGLQINAWMASAKATYSPNEQWKVYGGYDYLSGDEYFAVPPKGSIGMARHDKIRGFSSIYGSSHQFYGAMDFFYMSTYVGGCTPGLQNLYVGGTWNPFKKLSFDLAYHYLAIATKLEDSKRALGHEIETSVTYNIMKDVSVSAGYSFMRGTDTMVKLKRSSDNRQLQWAWVMLSVSPKIFTTMW
ncbi:MAG: alginate export family protein [Prevotella sp.]|nr:alginate export family protein [Prevotella sp.]